MLKEVKKIGLTVQENGTSKQVTVPSRWAHALDVEKGDLADAELNREEGSVTFYF